MTRMSEEKSKRAKRNRTAGHNYERKIASLYREAGYLDAVTTRQESRSLDNCKVDIARVPFYPQCKYGYKTMSVNGYIALLKEIDTLLKDHGDMEELPIVIHHRRGLAKFNDLVIMSREHYFEILKQLKK